MLNNACLHQPLVTQEKLNEHGAVYGIVPGAVLHTFNFLGGLVGSGTATKTYTDDTNAVGR